MLQMHKITQNQKKFLLFAIFRSLIIVGCNIICLFFNYVMYCVMYLCNSLQAGTLSRQVTCITSIMNKTEREKNSDPYSVKFTLEDKFHYSLHSVTLFFSMAMLLLF